MKVNIRYIKDKDLFELQFVEPQLRSHILLNRRQLNQFRTSLEKALIESKKNR